MALLKLAALTALGYVGYKYYEKNKREGHAAFATGQAPGENFAKVRDAGPEAMADPPKDGPRRTKRATRASLRATRRRPIDRSVGLQRAPKGDARFAHEP